MNCALADTFNRTMANPGTVDSNGVLWKSTSVGKFLPPAEGTETIWGCIKNAATQYRDRNAVGERSVVEKQVVDGFEKFVMSDEFSFLPCVAPSPLLAPLSLACARARTSYTKVPFRCCRASSCLAPLPPPGWRRLSSLVPSTTTTSSSSSSSPPPPPPPLPPPYRYGQYFSRIEALGSGLAKLPELKKGATVIIYADTQMLWMLSAFAAWRQGYVVGTIYATLGEEGAEFGINQSDCSLLFADGKLLKVLANIATKIPNCKRVVVFKAEDMDGPSCKKLKDAGIEVTSLVDVEAGGASSPCAPDPSGPDDPAVLMYTSGTTGNPKGVLITHKNISVMVAATISPTGPLAGFIKVGYRYLCYLPLAHIMELAVEIALLSSGFTLGYGGVGTLLPTSVKMLHANQKGDAQALKPDIFVAAPAVLDRVYNGASATFASKKGLVKYLIESGLESGKANFDNGGVGAGGCLPRIIFKKAVASKLGGNVKIMVTGSAPLGVEVQKFVQTVFNCPVRQGYGLTETCAGTCITTQQDNSTSCVGPPQECACIRLRDWEEGNYKNSDLKDQDIGMRRGEVLIGGPMVCRATWWTRRCPTPTCVEEQREEFVTIDGIRYFCTGDIGQFTETATSDHRPQEGPGQAAAGRVRGALKGRERAQVLKVHGDADVLRQVDDVVLHRAHLPQRARPAQDRGRPRGCLAQGALQQRHRAQGGARGRDRRLQGVQAAKVRDPHQGGPHRRPVDARQRHAHRRAEAQAQAHRAEAQGRDRLGLHLRRRRSRGSRDAREGCKAQARGNVTTRPLDGLVCVRVCASHGRGLGDMLRGMR